MDITNISSQTNKRNKEKENSEFPTLQLSTWTFLGKKKPKGGAPAN